MRYNNNSGYGRVVFDNFIPRAPHGKVVIVGAATLDNISIVQEIYGRGDPDGVLRWFSTLTSALAACYHNIVLSVTASTSADTFTTSTAHGLNNGDKVYIGGTAAPSGTTLGVVYYVVGATSTTFQVASVRGGSAIDLTTAGTAVKVFPITSVGDTIFVLPGHNENVSSSTALNLNVAGVNIIGLGTNETRPTFVLDTGTTSTITISAPGISISNIIVDATGFDAIASALTITTSDVTIDGCTFYLANATNQAGIGITTNALCHRFTFTNNRVLGTTDAGTTNALQIVGGDDIIIKNNYFFGAYTTSLGPINNATTACNRILIENNVLINATAVSTKAIVLVAGTTGMIRNNSIAILSGTAPITGAGTYVSGNYYVAAAGVTAGTLI